jgi:glycosyltransferase involved in cell wall biosynthesis
MRVLMIVQLVDEREWLRGFTIGWIRALAVHVERLDVITLEMGEADLPENVFVQSMGKEQGYSRPRMLWTFYRALAHVIRDVDAVFSHMTPRYTWLAAPYARLYRKPQMLWFTHRQVSLELRLALRAARWITTATHDSFPVDSPKVHVMGHGIDTARFSPGDTPPDDPPMVLAVGRVSPIKHHHTLLEAAALLRDEYGNPPVRFAVVGTTAAPGDEDYRDSLLRQRAELGFEEDDFALLGARTPDELITLYCRASVATNLSPVGLFDKAALEAMLTGTPLVVSNPAFADLLGDHRESLLVEGPDDAAGVAARIADLLARSPADRAALGAVLRERTAAQHGLDRLMRNIVALMQEDIRA